MCVEAPVYRGAGHFTVADFHQPAVELCFGVPAEDDEPAGPSLLEDQVEIKKLTSMPEDELYVSAKELQAPYELVKEIAAAGKLPVVLFTAGGIATPADAAMMMQLGADGVFVGSGIFKSGNPAQRAAAVVSGGTCRERYELARDF